MRRTVVTTVAALAVLVLGSAAYADPLEPFLERSGLAEFAGRQVVTCETPDGARTVAVDLVQVDGVTTARSGAAGSTEVRVAGGSFSVVTSKGSTDTLAAVSTAVPEGRYTVSKVESVQVLGRSAQRITVIDGEGVSRATMTFDLETGAMLVSRIRNADGSTYCDIRVLDFVESPRRTEAAPSAGSSRTLEGADPGALPAAVAGFARLETFAWDGGGIVAYYSDGLFSFTLLSTLRPVVLDDMTADSVTIDGGDYVRWFGAGQSIHVWDTETGGLAMYGDLPMDLQQAVLQDLPDPTRIGVLARWWRNLFG